MATLPDHGRIYFPGSPWLGGHRVADFRWTGRLTPRGEAWFDLHLGTDDYDAESGPAFDEDDGWRSATVWNNYGACILSSTFWRGGLAPFDGEHTGVRATAAGEPLSFASLGGRTLTADPAAAGDRHDDDRHHAFGIYLLGHDGVADHRIAFEPTPRPFCFDIHWTGRIALVYAGTLALNHTFEARIRSAAFEGFHLPPGLTEAQATQLAAAALAEPGAFALRGGKDNLTLIPRDRA